MSLLFPEDIASHLGSTREEVIRQCRAGRYPHVRVGKHYRFTEADRDAITELLAVQPKTPEKSATWGLVTRGGGR